MPEIIETITATLSKKWTEKLRNSELKTDSAEVCLTTSKNQVRLEGPKDDVLQCVNRLQELVVGKLTTKESTSAQAGIAHIDMGFADMVVPASTAKYQLGEPVWEYVKFSDPTSRWDDKLTPRLDHNGRIEVTGPPADVDQLRKLCWTGRFAGSIVSMTCPLPRGSSVDFFKSSMESKKVLIRTTSDSSYCQLIGELAAVQEASESLTSHADHSVSASSSATSVNQLSNAAPVPRPSITPRKSKTVISSDNLLPAQRIPPPPAAATAAVGLHLTPHSGTDFPMPHSQLIGELAAVQEASASLTSHAGHSMYASSSAASSGQPTNAAPVPRPSITPRKSKNVISPDNLLPAQRISPPPAAAAAAVRLTPHSGSEDFPMPHSSGQLTVSVQTGSILNSGCEVIVSLCNKSLSLTSGTAKVIADAAGQLLTQECSIYTRTVGNLNVSGVMDTTAGNIPPPVKWVIHAVWSGKDRSDRTASEDVLQLPCARQ